MLGLELRSAKNPDIILYNAAQPVSFPLFRD